MRPSTTGASLPASRTVRVMVVDDSVVVRRLVTDVLETDPAIEVVATAANGRLAVEKLAAVDPDVVTLDIEMPEMDGLATLREIRRTHPRLPVIMFSTLTERGAAATLDALAAGATDFVTKPANVGSVTKGMQAVREDLIPKVLTAAGIAVRPAATTPAAGAAVSMPATSAARAVRPATVDGPYASVLPAGHRVSLVVVGVSTGGPAALAALWPALRPLPVPVVVVQHMPPVFTEMLARRLDAVGTIPMAEATDATELVPGRAWLAPGDHHVTLDGTMRGAVMRVGQGPHENSCRPAVDPLFRTAAGVYGPGVLGIVLTGMGVDGQAGARAIRDAGGHVIAQDEASSVVWGMPGAVARSGAASAVLPLDRIAATVMQRVAATPHGSRSEVRS